MECALLSPTLKLDTGKAENLGKNLADEVNSFEPYIIKDVLLLSPGIWNNKLFTSDGIRFGFSNTNWEDKKNYDLIYSHDAKAENWVGYVKNRRLDDQGKLFGDLEIYDRDLAIKLGKAKAKMGISARVLGDLQPRGEFDEFMINSFNNFSIVYEPACEEAWINLSKDESLLNITKKEEKNDMIDEKINSQELSSSKIVELLENFTAKVEKLSSNYEVLSNKIAELEKEPEAEVEEVKEEVKEEPKEEPTEEVVEETAEEEPEVTEEAVEETPVEEVKEDSELESKVAALEARIAELSKAENSPAPVVAELSVNDLGEGISQLSKVEMRLLNELTRKSSLNF